MKLFRLPASRFYLALAVFCGLALFGYVFALRSTMLWDFKTCYAAGWLVRHGQSPYQNHLLFAVSSPYDFPFAYPLLAACFFVPFTFVSYPAAALGWICIEAIAWVVLAMLWYRYSHPKPVLTAFPLLILGLFNMAVAKNLITGNIATIESLLLWTGFVFLARGSVVGFVGFLLAGASFKLAPVILILLPLLHPHLRRWRVVVLGVAAFCLFLGAGWAIAPDWWKGYQNNVAYNFQQWALRDVINPSSYALSRRLVFEINPDLSVHDHLLIASILYSVFAFSVLLVSARAIRALADRPWTECGKSLILYATLIYALVVPRFSDYSFTLVIPAALYAVGSIRAPAGCFFMITALLLPLPFVQFSSDPDFRGDIYFGQWSWWSFLMVFVCWCVFTRLILRGEAQPVKKAREDRRRTDRLVRQTAAGPARKGCLL